MSGLPRLGDLSDDDLDVEYAAPRTPWLRVNMISSLDGAASGPDGKSGGINNAADKRVFDCLRRLADAVVVGAGTARDEGYRGIEKPLVLVSRSGAVPDRLREEPVGAVRMATCANAEHLAETRDLLGAGHVHVLGEDTVDLARLRAELGDLGFGHLLCEGGPHLLRDLLAAGAVDELDLTLVPRLLAGDHPQITAGGPVDVPLSLGLLLEADGTLLTRWFC